MDTSTRFFSKLRSLAVLLDTERANLEHTASLDLDQDYDDAESGAVQALHELHSEVRGLKKRVQGQVASQEDGSTELRSFVKACMVLKQRTTEDIERIQRHYEKYGYKPQKVCPKPEGEADARCSVDGEPEGELSEEMAGDEDEPVEAPECETPEKMAPPAVDPMRTPQLSDFGLSALHLQMVLGNSEMSHGLAPAVALTPPSLDLMMMHESQPKTPKCSLIMDEEALTPRLEDFGITESTMCFNNDFTMDLFRKRPPKDRQTNSTTQQIAQRGPHSLPTSPSCVPRGRLSADSMESPEVPLFSTLEIKMNKQLGQSYSPPNRASDPGSPSRPSAAPATPELPTFETPYVGKLISARKETKRNEVGGLTGSPTSTSFQNEGPSVRVSPSEKPQMPVGLSQMEETMPEMPRLQSFFSSTLPHLVAQANKQQPTTTSVLTSSKTNLNTLAPGKENRTPSVAQVSEKEFHGLASYMKQIPLASLNSALNKINQVLDKRRRDGLPNSEEFHTEDLRKILDVGPQTPMYIFCLLELKRLENVQGCGRNAIFKILTKT
ncbi:spindle and kinetochore-associated protein 3 isoform X3 [Ictalurus punctatus]|uniref:Spindle and kinetochore-associated protein 3 isoform X3 n=1 Tax=Ictalurus punctatus TaxID=7998 RepID=A0A2D0R6U5_ICTPU|nr:spindle and kinetochore-associated protein 3 isoform X3 [Ictalurus punctatus]